MQIGLEEIARKTSEAFASLLLMRDFHGSSGKFQEHFKQVVQHMRDRAEGLTHHDTAASRYYAMFADALEAWNRPPPAVK